MERLEILVRPTDGGGAKLRWTRTYTGLNKEGNELLGIHTGRPVEERMERVMALLERNCESDATAGPGHGKLG